MANAQPIIVSGVEFIDSTNGKDGTMIYSLVDEQSAECVGVYDDVDALTRGIEALLGKGRSLHDLWGSVYILNEDMEPSFSM